MRYIIYIVVMDRVRYPTDWHDEQLKVIFLVLAVVTAILADYHEHSHDESIENLVERTNKITSSVFHLDSLLDARLDAKRIRRAGSLRARVEALEGPSCPDLDIQCGRDDPQCISELFVCDGHKDCRNGEDEKDCTIPVKAGDKFVGDVVYDHCTKRRPEHITLVIESVSTIDNYTPTADLHVHIEIKSETDEDESKVSLPADAIYWHAYHELIVEPPEDDGLGLLGAFDGYNFDRFVGKIIHTRPDEPCAEFIFHRQ